MKFHLEIMIKYQTLKHFPLCFKQITVPLNYTYNDIDDDRWVQTICFWQETKCVTFPTNQHQENYNDCGIHSVAFFMSRIFGYDPTFISYDRKNLRKTFMKILLCNCLENFPLTYKDVENTLLLEGNHCYLIKSKQNIRVDPAASNRNKDILYRLSDEKLAHENEIVSEDDDYFEA